MCCPCEGGALLIHREKERRTRGVEAGAAAQTPAVLTAKCAWSGSRPGVCGVAWSACLPPRCMQLNIGAGFVRVVLDTWLVMADRGGGGVMPVLRGAVVVGDGSRLGPRCGVGRSCCAVGLGPRGSDWSACTGDGGLRRTSWRRHGVAVTCGLPLWACCSRG